MRPGLACGIICTESRTSTRPSTMHVSARRSRYERLTGRTNWVWTSVGNTRRFVVYRVMLAVWAWRARGVLACIAYFVAFTYRTACLGISHTFVVTGRNLEFARTTSSTQDAVAAEPRFTGTSR